jgi:hypothetical protein
MMPTVEEALSTLQRTIPSWSADVTDVPRAVKRLAELLAMTPLFPEIPNDPPGAEAPLSSAHAFPSLAVPQPFVLFARTNVSMRMEPVVVVGAALATGVLVVVVLINTDCAEVTSGIFSSGTIRQRTARMLRHRVGACTGIGQYLPIIMYLVSEVNEAMTQLYVI